MLFLFQ